MSKKASQPEDQSPNFGLPGVSKNASIEMAAESIIRGVIREDERAAGFLSIRETKPGRVAYRTDSKVHTIQTAQTGEGSFLDQRDSQSYVVLSNDVFSKKTPQNIDEGQTFPVGRLQIVSYLPGFKFTATTRRMLYFLNNVITEAFEDGRIHLDDSLTNLIPLTITLEDWIKFTGATSKEWARQTFHQGMAELLSITFFYRPSAKHKIKRFTLSSHDDVPLLADGSYDLNLDPYGAKRLFDPNDHTIMVPRGVFGANIQRFPCSIDLVVECYSWLYQYVLDDDATVIIPMRKLIKRLPGVPDPEDKRVRAMLKAKGMASPAMLTRQTILPIMEAARHQFARGHLRWDIIPSRIPPLNMDKHVYENELRKKGRLVTFTNRNRRPKESIAYADAINGYFVAQLPSMNADDVERWRVHCENTRNKSLGSGDVQN